MGRGTAMHDFRFETMAVLDAVFASQQQKKEARQRAFKTWVQHGPESFRILRKKLKDRERRQSRRLIRLAIVYLRKETNFTLSSPVG